MKNEAHGPTDPQSLYQTGLAHFRVSNFAQARAALLSATKARPDRAEWYVLLARAQIRRGDPACALTAVSRAIVFDGTKPAWHVLLAEVEEKLGRTSAAISAAERAVELD